jgi:hypothetical protein
VIDAKGRDARGAGNAAAVITADLVSDGGATTVTVSTDLKLTGRIAQFGSGMIQEVSRELLGQFVACLETKLATAGPPVAEGTTAPPAPPAPSSASEPASAAEAEPAALNVLALSRGAVAKRVVPLIVGLVVVAVVIYLLVR